MENRIEYLRHQIEVAEIHNDSAHVKKCQRELRQLDKCYDCPYLCVDAIPSASGDGYGSSFEHCDPPMGECRLELAQSIMSRGNKTGGKNNDNQIQNNYL